MSKSGIPCYRNGGCGPYEMRSCSECPASKSDYLQHNVKKQQTNADRIRAMTDEELASWLSSISGCDECEELHGIMMCERTPEKHCKECWLDWLKQLVRLVEEGK